MQRDEPGLMLRQSGASSAANLPESLLLYKRPGSHATGVLNGLTDFADITAPGVSFALSGPSVKLDPEHLPVRGDVAHIRLAGQVFVPHYVVPMPHTVNAAANGAPTPLRKAGHADSDVLAELPAGTLFNVLDVSGGWAWGQVGEDGAVGYVAVIALTPLP